MQSRPVLRFRAAILLATLVCSLSATAQQEYYEGSITHADRNGQRIWLHDGKPLEGLCKISYLDTDLAARYTLARYRDGVRSDTVSYHSAASDQLLLRIIHLSDNARHIYKYQPYGSYITDWLEADGEREGTCREWYAEGKLRCTKEYRAGKLEGLSREWDEAGRLVWEGFYRNDVLDGHETTWHHEAPGTGEIEVASHRRSDRPYLVECYASWEDQRGLIERKTLGSDGETIYSESKPDCDSTRIDTLCGQRMIVEFRDYKEGTLRSLERFDTFTGYLVPHGIFELYAPDGRIGIRMSYEDGELIAVRNYDEDEPREDVRLTLLSRQEGDRLLRASSDSKHLDGSVECRPLCIRNRAGEVLLTVDEEDRRYEYHGYDPRLHLHVGFSSEGSWNDICWYVVYDHDGVTSFLDLREELFAVHGTSGLIAVGTSRFEDELDIQVYRFVEDGEVGGFFEQVFTFTLPELPEAVWGLHWLGESSLLLCMEKNCIRLDIDPESLTWQPEEMY